MSIVVNTNLSAMMAQKNLNAATSALTTSIERMSTGLKINKAADDAAGLSIATNLNTKIRGSQVAQSNIQQGVTLLQTAEGQLSGISDNVSRIRDLAAQAANGINSSAAKTAIIKEVKARVAEIDKAASGAEFNGVKLFDSNTSDIATKGLRLQVGAGDDSTTNSITVKDIFTKATSSALGLFGTSAVNGNTPSAKDIDTAFTTASTAAKFIKDCDNALSTLTTKRSDIGAYQNRLNSNLDSLTVSIENMSAAKSVIMDTDVAQESAKLTKSQILQQVSTSLLAQANQTPAIALSLI